MYHPFSAPELLLRSEPEPEVRPESSPPTRLGVFGITAVFDIDPEAPPWAGDGLSKARVSTLKGCSTP